MDLSELERVVGRLDRVLRPIAHAPVDRADPDWLAKWQQAPPPVERAGVAVEAGAALAALIAAYGSGDDGTRTAIRELLSRFTSFRWAVPMPGPRDTADGFRACLLHWSAVDQGPDTRDELLSLWDLCDRAKRAGVEVAPILVEVAGISSTVDRYGMGSTRQLLLDCVNR